MAGTTRTGMIIATAIRTKMRLSIAVSRIFTLAMAAFSVAWGASDFFSFRRYGSLERMAAQIVSGIPFQPDALSQLIPAADAAEQAPLCHANAIRSAAIVKLRFYEIAYSESPSSLDMRLKDLDETLRLFPVMRAC